MPTNSRHLTRVVKDSTYPSRFQGCLFELKNGKWESNYGVIKANMLYIFKKQHSECDPMSLYILEDYYVELCDGNDTGKAFSFLVKYISSGRNYTFATDSLSRLENWVSVLTLSTLEYIRLSTQMYQDQMSQLKFVDYHVDTKKSVLE